MNASFVMRILEKRNGKRLENARGHSLILFLTALALLLFLPAFETQAATQAPPEKTPAETAIVRPCPAAPANSAPAPKDKKKGKITPGDAPGAAPGAAPACLEAKATSLEIQEFLQTYAREQKWNIGDGRSSESGWTFSRILEKEELLQFAKEPPASRVSWTGGKALVQVRTTDLQGGFTRMQISARFQGHGENADHFAPPQDTWELNSNGTLESAVISALETHFQSLR
jgi:hypothetical protein